MTEALLLSFAFAFFNIFPGRDAHSAFKYFGKILRVGIAAAGGNIRYACKALLNQSAGLLYTYGVQVFDNSNAEILLKNRRDVFFVIRKLAAYAVQGKTGNRRIIVYIFFYNQRNVALSAFLIKGQGAAADKGEGVQQNTFAYQIGQRRINFKPVFPEIINFGTVRKDEIICGNFQLFHNHIRT